MRKIIITVAALAIGGLVAAGCTSIPHHAKPAAVTKPVPAITAPDPTVTKPVPVTHPHHRAHRIVQVAPSVAPAPPTNQLEPDSSDPAPGTGTGGPCTTIAGYYPAGLPGHYGTGGFCVADA
jgi:hypothetical protein